jgi:NAD(P)-dependent dehydrogenase (short-subunit alcohol dehydrogenase family)
MRYAITGASRGLGLEFVRQLLTQGHSLDAGVRSPSEARELQGLARESGGRLRVHALDVAQPQSVVAFAAAPFATNALGPLRLTAALLPALRRGSVRRIIHLSSRMGSIGDNRMGGSYSYRLSKAALNMAVRNLHVDLHGEGFITVVLHPGWVQTDMGGPQAPLRPEQSVRGMLTLIDKLQPSDSGRFLDFDGQELPW